MDEAESSSVSGFFYKDKNPPAHMPMGKCNHN